MFTIRYSQKGSLRKLDMASCRDCRPSEADANQDEVIELAESKNVPPVILKDICDLDDAIYKILPRCLDYKRMPRKGPLPMDWSLDIANEKARKICQNALQCARKEGNYDLRLAKTVYEEYKSKGYLKERTYKHMDLSQPTVEDVYASEGYYGPSELIGWGDEEVTDDHREENDDGTVSYKVRTVYFADPWGAEAFNVVELVISVEVIPSKVEG